MKTDDRTFDVIIIGSGMGGMSAASMLANDGYSVLVLEAAHALGGCSSSYKRKGYIFETGATTLIGFDRHQPMKILEDKLGITLPKTAIHPPMQVQIENKTITRWGNKQQWIAEAIRHFDEPDAQETFWDLAFRVADVVWKVSGKNHFFPPQRVAEWLHLFKNDPRDVWVLPYALQSVRKVALNCGITNPLFYRFLDEQLMISAQAGAGDTPFLFGAPAITYTNSTNYYVPGGLIEMVHTIRDFITERSGVVKTKEPVVSIDKTKTDFSVTTHRKNGKQTSYSGRCVISNLPVWNMGEITHGAIQHYFTQEAKQYQKAWGAYTMGVAFVDKLDPAIPLHHQIHLTQEDHTEGLYSGSIFVSLSHPDDSKRSPGGMRTMNISTHVVPEWWFSLNGRYDELKENVRKKILQIVVRSIPGLHTEDIDVAFASTPVTWSNWVYRRKGRVGGIPQQMDRSLLDWTPNATPFDGLYMVGDTVFPGQGIPGVTLSGINVYYRVRNYI